MACSGTDFPVRVAVDGRGRAWIIWAENKSYPATALANFDLWACSIADGTVSPPMKLSDTAGTDVNAVAATDAAGRVWVAWQGARDNVFRILERHQDAGGAWSAERTVSTQNGNCWMPAIATAVSGKIAIGWDTYDKGDYDVWLREFAADGTAAAARPAANSTSYEARPSLAYDKESRLWVAWESSGPT